MGLEDLGSVAEEEVEVHQLLWVAALEARLEVGMPAS